jgi:type I restriction enzyme M protein
MTMMLGGDTARLKKTHFISYLFNHQNDETMCKADGSPYPFHELFDNTLVDIANYNLDIFSVQTGGEEKIRLFDPISQYVIERAKKPLFCRAIINKLVEFSFADVFEQKYDFFSQIFEYLIKDYNKDFGKYAEYYTPHSIANIIARIMVQGDVSNVSIYDPAAGSGTLVLALAHQIGEDNCTIFTQDISAKSNEFLRLNLILNNLVHSLGHVVHDDTLISPRHLNAKKNGLAQFDYIVSNPPFNTDFSNSRDELAGDKHKERFFAGVPNIPKKDIDKMPVYLLFIQHIIYSLAPKGKAAIVVPTGFLTAGTGIPKKIREYLIKERMLRGVISMPSNIFATTGTNVSILFLDRENKDGNVILMDASKLGTKEKLDGKNQRTVLSQEEIAKIIDTFNEGTPVDDFCVTVTYGDIEKKKFSFSAGQYFEVKIEYVELTPEEFAEKMHGFTTRLDEMFAESRRLEDEIKKQLGRVKYE